MVEAVKLKIMYFIYRMYLFMRKFWLLRKIKKAVERVIIGVLKVIRPKQGTRRTAGPVAYDMTHFMFTVLPYNADLRVPAILTIVDIQQEYHPEFFSKSDLELRERSYRSSADRADHIIAISTFTGDTLVEKYCIPENKISVVLLGYNRNAFKRLKRDRVEEFRRKYRLPRGFLFYPAATWPHKNHMNLLRAYKLLKDRNRFEDKLVLTGIKEQNHKAVKNEIIRLGLQGDVIHLGYLPYKDLPLLYNAAKVMVFPSFFEGFGLPVVEAMAVGLPVACSNVTSLPEVAGEAALLFDPASPEDIAEKVSMIYADKGLREELIRRGLERARLFTWENTARKTLKVYEEVFKKTGRGTEACGELTSS